MQVLQSKLRDQIYDYKEEYCIVTKLLFLKEESSLPPSDDLRTLPEDFNDFFLNKVRNIMTVLQENQLEVNSSEDIEFQLQVVFRLEFFLPSTLDFISRLVKKVPPKSCELDPIPTTLLKQSIEVLVPVISHIIHISLKQG